ncbi:hypothetical protein GCM10009836_66190 [Pseudonocardia ailaonensis]|uniref:Integral membrane protein n=1 Tax=Pseudonocardia ailaonensis TaxID=367279 RepID=A0ABN2NP48_9PSEU
MSAPRRPGSVTVVVVLTWISAVLALLGGIALLVLGASAPNRLAVIVGVVYVLIGLVTGAVASRLGKGGRGARLLVTILTVLQIVGALTALTGVGATTATSSGWGSIVIGLLLLYLLWNARANAFFAGQRPL